MELPGRAGSQRRGVERTDGTCESSSVPRLPCHHIADDPGRYMAAGPYAPPPRHLRAPLRCRLAGSCPSVDAPPPDTGSVVTRQQNDLTPHASRVGCFVVTHLF